MIVSNQLRRKYDSSRGLVEYVGREVSRTLAPFCDRQGFLFAGRHKSLDSVAEKIESGRYETWDAIEDLFACTVIISLVSEEKAVVDFVKEAFDVVQVTLRHTRKRPPKEFHFDSTKIVARLRPVEGSETDEGADVYNLKFEVQVKTIFDYAWAKTTHTLAYKAGVVDWRRERLAAQMKAAAEQLDLMAYAFERTASIMGRGRWPDVRDKERIYEFFRKKFEGGSIPTELQPKDWSRFCDNIYRYVQAVNGMNPTGRSERALGDQLKDFLDELDRELTDLGRGGVPTSMSLFQFVLSVFGGAHIREGKTKRYWLPVTDEVKVLFPSVRVPGGKFQVN